MSIVLLFSLIISFTLTFITIPFWIRKASKAGLVWEDMNKSKKLKNVAGSGGIVVVMAFAIGILYYIATRTFFFREPTISLEIFALLSVVLLFTMIGIVDDLFGWKNKGLSRRTRLLLAFVASIPLVVINAGGSVIHLPLIGAINLGLLYPLVLIPLGVVGAATTYNFLAGYNGLETGQGILIIGFLSLVAYITGTLWLGLVGLTMVAALVGFLFYNKFPAKIFPGDSLTWAIGALIAGMAILGNFERIAIFVFIPYIIEVGLKLRGKLEKQSFGKPNKDNSLELPYSKIYGLEHLAIYVLKRIKSSKKVYEKDVVYLIHGFQIFIIILACLIFL
ncbi:glycosyl transferase family 4 [Candidatus Pacearchaeota archaeon]|nr:glycosyl transferase family 4 [Candidatus Pacearchaeota archaeon]